MRNKIISGVSIVLMVISISACQTIPDNAASDHMRQGMIFVNQGDFNNAVKSFKSSIAVNPTADAYANLGASYMQLGKRNLAMTELQNAEGMDPYHALSLYNMTALHSLNDNTDLALQYLDRALTSGFDNYDAVRFDPDLENLRGESDEFRGVLEKHKIFIQ